MELCAVDVAAPHNACDRRSSVLGNGQGVPGAAGGVKAMDIVDVFSVPEIAEDGVLA